VACIIGCSKQYFISTWGLIPQGPKAPSMKKFDFINFIGIGYHFTNLLLYDQFLLRTKHCPHLAGGGHAQPAPVSATLRHAPLARHYQRLRSAERGSMRRVCALSLRPPPNVARVCAVTVRHKRDPCTLERRTGGAWQRLLGVTGSSSLASRGSVEAAHVRSSKGVPDCCARRVRALR